MNKEQAAALRAPFPPEAIGKIPKAGTTLDYVGHAAVTDRLLSVDPEWEWWTALDDAGLPQITQRGNDSVLWIHLTVCGITRYGVGIVATKSFELEKQLISDAIRNAAMRFGVALDLWSKEDLNAGGVDPTVRAGKVQVPAPLAAPSAASEIRKLQQQNAEGAKGRVRTDEVVLSPPVAPSATSPGDVESALPANGGAVPVVSAPQNAGSTPAAAPPISKNQLQRLQSKMKQLLADNVKVADRRTAAGLPALTKDCTADELDRWEALLTEIEAALAAPFEPSPA